MSAPRRPEALTTRNGQVIPIKWRKTVKVDGGIASGYARFRMYPPDKRAEIVIDDSRTPAFQAQTLLHELLHVAMAPIRFPHDLVGLEHVAVYTIEENLGWLWQQNPEVFEWIHSSLCATAA